MSYTLIGNNKTRAIRVRWLLEELGVSYTHIPDYPHTEEVQAHNPSGKVPVLLVDGEAITDSAAILTYLADKHQKFTNPPGSVARAQQDALMHKILDELDAILWMASRHGSVLPEFVLPKSLRVPGIEQSLKWEFERNLNRVMNLCQGDYLMGEELTVPDIILTHCGNWAKAVGFKHGNGEFEAYMERTRSRPAYQAAWDRGSI